jgi:exosortase
MKANYQTSGRAWIFVTVSMAAVLAIFFKPLIALTRLALSDENVSHVPLIPIIVGWLLYSERKRIFTAASPDLLGGSLFAVGALISSFWGYYSAANLQSPDALSFYILALVLACIAIFAFAFGRQTLRRGFFAFAMLFLVVPWPSFVLQPVISYLQYGSADIANAIFVISGAPVLREGLVFHLPRAIIEVAPECSGIRSSMALLVLALLISHFSFHRFWKKAVFVIAGVFIMIVKNGIRIATLTLLANYVDPGFLYGNLHREGGVVFFLIGLLLLAPIYWLLKRGEIIQEDITTSLAQEQKQQTA